MKLKPERKAVKSRGNFLIVGMGASAGGLHSLECFLSALPRKFDFALVFMQHLSATHKSLLPELLRSHHPHVKIEEITDGLKIEAGKLYLCPPARETRLENRIFALKSLARQHVHLPIDEFFISLAEEAEDNAIGVIFSGAGTDGARGIQMIKTMGGTAFVQQPETAEFTSMPLAAIATGQADNVLPPDEIAGEIMKIVEARITPVSPDALLTPAQFDAFYKLIFTKTGNRFKHYKKSVVGRRITRRMYLHGISSVDDYSRFVSANNAEARQLALDLMIGVTSFFRDRPAWKALSLSVMRKLAAQDTDAPIRVWTPACATGEESYSAAMLLAHELDLTGRKREINIFATDINELILEKARHGTYPASIASDIPPEYLKKFFTASTDEISVSISKDIRDLVVFAKQDLLSDPPFSRLDLIICRNLLIYLEPDAQEKCISLFNYALNNSGYLFLGNAESVGLTGKNLFRSLGHKKCRIYQKTETAAAIKSPFAVPFAAERAAASSFRGRPAFEVRQEAVAAIQEALLEEFVPAMVAIDQNYNILYHNGPTNRYLRHPRGTPTWNLLELLPDEVRVRLRGALHRAEKETKPVAVRLPLHGDASGKKYASLRISKLRENIYSIIFRDKAGSSGQADADDAEITAGEETAVRQLETELIATRQDLQNHIEQLKSLNEEIQSSNEELQAANEELETSREELQSLNEELVTVNTQLQSKIEEQEETNSDLNNFLESTNIPTLFLDRKLRVKRFTPAMLKLIKLIPADIERPIIDMSRENLGSDLLLDAEAVLESLLSIKRDLTINGSWYIRTTLPYRTFDGRIGGVVITYSDITDLKQVQEKLSVAKDDWERTFDSVPDLIAILDSNHLVRRVNRAMAQRLGLKPEQCIGLPCYEAVHGLSAPPPFCPHSRTIADSLEHVEEVHESRLGGDFVVSTTPLYDDQGRMTGSVHVAHDITERKKAEDALRESRERLDLALLSSRMATFDWDIINNKRTWSNGVHGLLGTKPETFTGSAEEFFQIMHPEDRSTVQAALARAVETTGEYETEYRAVWPDGSIHYIAARGRVHRDNAGRAVLMTGVCWDITGRKKAEEAVQESEERFRNMFEHHKAVMLLVEPGSGAIVDANTAAADFYKQSREGLRASNIQDINLLPPEEVAAEREKAATEERSHFIFPHRIADGEVRWVEVYSTPIQVGRTPVLFSIIHDITGRREAEEQIRQHVEDLRSNNEELERLNRAMVGRELRMIELKKEINECCRREGQPPRYNLDFEKEQP